MNRVPFRLRIVEILSVLCWVAGIIAVSHHTLRVILWGMPASFAVALILRSWFIDLKSWMGIPDGDVTVKKIDLNGDDLPPEIKAKIISAIEDMQEKDILPKGKIVNKDDPEVEKKKCDDPHCEGCWGLAEK